MLHLERLRVLDAVAVHGSLARAARALHITPSGVSQQLARLERESGHRLTTPHGRSVRLTHAGRVLAEHAARVVAEARAAESDLADLGEEILGPLRLGGVGSPLRALLPYALAGLTAAHPRLIPTLVDGEVVDLLPRLLSGELDLLIIESWTNRPMPLPEGLVLSPLADEPVHAALSAHHPLADADSVELGALDGVLWTSCPAGTEPYEALVQAVRAAGGEPEVRYTVTEFATQLALVAQGLAAALVPEMGQRPAPPGVRFVPTDPPLRREVYAAWRAGAESPSVRACVDALTESAARA
ncbi:LysR family transcriptional regulator [Streptomyces sp. ODS28]|uniref:LysR family transcriptional regulator n=1 Tax=Streptomyces sp. ODS28 TaxID=3136688 RepID=UPI0031E627DA